MVTIKQLTGPSPTTTSQRMKSTFVVLCIVLCIISFLLYSRTTLNWTILHTIITTSFISSSKLFDTVNLTTTTTLPRNVTTATVTVNSSQTIKTNITALPPWKNRRFAIFACSIHSKTLAYTFYTPLTAATWQRIGYEAIVVFVGDFKLNGSLNARLNLVRNYLKQVGAFIVDIQCNESYAVKLSQLVRVFSGFLPDTIVHDDDNILTGDSDLMPLKASEYQPSTGTDGFIFNAFCCGSFQRRGRSYRMFPMGHVFLQKKTWRALLMESKQRAELLVGADNHTQFLLSEKAPLSFETISLYGRHEFKTVYDQNMDKGDSAWYMDQVFCSMLLIDYREKHKNLSISERGRADRLDRAAGMSFWDRENFDQFGDAHLKHDEILHENNWKIFNKLLKHLFNETMIILFNDYYKQYMILGKTSSKR